MDSGDSGSMQSSSGGDEEYDSSRAESISAFLNSSGHVGGSISTTTTTNTTYQQPPLPPHLHQHSSSSYLFDSLSNYLSDPYSRPTPPPPPQNPSSLLNLDMVLTGSNLRSEPNSTNFNHLMSSQPSSSSQPISGLPQGMSGRVNLQTQSSIPSLPTDQQLPNQQSQQQPARNPKKRSRASRRAPTTVLTTDTSNFRAMVQEFTGIPAPPFSASAFPRTRLDLFNTSSTIRSGHLDPSPPYLLRPFAQKLNPPPFLSSSTSSIIDHVINASSSTTTANPNPNTSTTTSLSTSTSNNYQLLSDQLGLPKQSHDHQNLLNMQNPSLIPYHSLLQSSSTTTPTPLKYPPLSVHSRLKMGVLEDFSMNNENVIRTHLGGGGGLPNHVTSDNNPSSNLGIGGSNDGDQDLLRSFNGNYSNSQQRVINNNGCKLNYSAGSPSDFNAEKGSADQNNVSSRGEGMVDSWICSSD